MTAFAVCTNTPCFSRSHSTGKERDAESGNDSFGGRQIARLLGGQWTDLVYGTSGLLAEVAGTQTATPVYRMMDHLGTQVGTLSSTGAVLSLTDYAPFGQVFSGGSNDPYKFTGKERDSESGNDYFGARYYASSMGRWMSPDLPFADQDPANPQSWNLYGYVRNNPLNSIDNDGLLTILIGGTDWQTTGGWSDDSNALFGYADGPLHGTCVISCTELLNWSGGNSDIERIKGAEKLRAIIAAHYFAPGEKLNIISHSHGGNVALAASHLGLSHRIDNLITLNKPTLLGAAYLPGANIGNFYNISAAGDGIQLLGSDAAFFATDQNATNKVFDTSSSHIRPHAALIWDDKIRQMWWSWFLNQNHGSKPDNGCATNPNGQCIYSPVNH